MYGVTEVGGMEEHVSITIKQGNGVLMRFGNKAYPLLEFNREQKRTSDKLKR